MKNSYPNENLTELNNQQFKPDKKENLTSLLRFTLIFKFTLLLFFFAGTSLNLSAAEVSCTPSITCPAPDIIPCNDQPWIYIWLDAYTTELCGMTGTSVSNDYDPADFSSCSTTTKDITFTLKDASGAILDQCVSSLTVTAAPVANIHCPPLFPIGCADVANYVPPMAHYFGACGASGTVSGIVTSTPAPNGCGGYLTVTYSGVDDCGRPLPNETCYVIVLPAPLPVISCPTIAPIECADVANFVPPMAPYSGDCGISGMVSGTVTSVPNSYTCGGTLVITYSGVDECNRPLDPITCNVTINPAPEATVTPPTFPSTISCVMAENFSAGNATYSNGLTGACEISGTITPNINAIWGVCGGLIIVSYSDADECGRPLYAGDFTIIVDPAPEATVTPPTFPTSISCTMAETFTAGDATYTNGLTGACEISGTITADVTPNWTICGGTITINYGGPNLLDPCGRPISAGPFVITVEPAPEATVTPPTFPTSISCVMAETFTAADATYTNGLTGVCEISGTITADVTPAWNECGGTITINYGGPNLLDPCGRVISAGPFVINVEAAPEATVTPPTFPSSISCVMAENFTADDATYTNGLTGACEISGTITATVTPAWDACGGMITINYNSQDQCSRPLTAGPFVITVEPAPEATVTPPTFPSSISCVMAENFTADDATYTNGLTGACEISGSITATVTPVWDVCGGMITISYSSQDQCNRPLSAGPFVITVDPAPEASIFDPASFPSNISCEAGFAFQAPIMSYTNGLTGACEISGTLQPIVIPVFDKCGGTITIDYLGLDECGRIIHPGPFVITVDPAPEATLTVPNLSTPISCSEADGYSPPNATYTNGLTGACEISGEITATVDPYWDVCGGYIIVDYNGMDECNRPFHAGPFNIMVEPAPEATVTPPTFPSTISCAMAETFMADDATYTNGLTGACEISGTITADVTPNWTICGGTITINYGGANLLDPCDRPISAGPFVITVEPAPEATVTPPTFPSSISCVMAENFSAADATYTNGLTGVCEISGTITANVDPAWNECGGTITINYGGPNLLDPCGRPISAGPFVITVEPAPEATVTPPTFPTTISCVMAENFSADDATYTNGLTGACEISGTITATVTPAWDGCGGSITISYSSQDQCGRTLSAGPFTITVDAAPEATPASILFLNPISCEQGFAFVAPNLPYSNNLPGACNISGTITPTVTNDFTKCGGTITVEYIGEDECGRPLHSGPFVITVEPAPEATIFDPASFPSNISCEDGFAFQAPIMSYTNGLTGACEISGTLQPIVINAFDKCGGTITIDYLGEDECDRVIHPGPFVITVDPAPEATVTAPVFATPITCEEAFAFSAPNATYTNGLTGSCEISGEITATVVNSFDKCGGTITVSYLAEDDCARILQAGPFVIDVTPAPEATVTAPDFPTNISCVMAEIFVAGNATYDNGLSGDCNISGTIQPNVTNNWSECGGTIMISYMTTDECGRPVSAGPFTIVVDPAPEATVTAPDFPSSISCAAAEAFVAPNATYTNSINGACNISGSIAPTVVNNWTLCGGTITVSYSAEDQCGRPLMAGPFVINVDPTPEATVTAPVFPTTITCVEADNFMAGIATYTNSQTGVCEITGTIDPTVVEAWGVCGGTITVSYTAEDPCGRALTAGPFLINVLPAPEATLTPPPFSSPMACVTAETFSPADATYTNGLTGTCEISGTITADVVENWDACGGTISYSYTTLDPCGRIIQSQVFTIVVQPAPVPTISLQTLQASVSCEEAMTYVPPIATYSNGLTGACNLSGTASSLVNHFYDACGGTLQVIYFAEDDCGRSIPKFVLIVDVDPAPAPTIMVPTFPSSLSCSEAQSFEAPYTPYDNGLDGDCNISGIIQPSLSYNVDECNGGTMTIQYDGEDECGNSLILAPIVIQVEPAPPATLKGPGDVPNTIYCWDAAYGYSAGNATYNNGETGFCENSGEIEPVITELWNNCDGGYIIFDYSGEDDCGNELTPIVFKVAVLPDTWAPDGGCAPYEETTSSIYDVPEPNELGYYLSQIAAGYSDEGCSEVIVSVIDDTGAPQCNGNDFYQRIYTVEITDECGNIGGECTITFSGSCSQDLCTMNQKFYGNPDAEVNGQTSGTIIETLIANGANPIVIGDGTDCGFIIDDLTCIQAMMNSYGEAISLPTGFSTNCFDLNNSLINQMVVTILNIRYNETMNPSGQMSFGGLLLSDACLNVPGWMLAELPANPTVDDLLSYANNFVACQCSSTCGEFQPNMAELTNLFWGLNSRFNNCYSPTPCGSNILDPNINSEPPVLTNNTLELYPNPTDDVINLKVNHFIGLPAMIEIFDTRGAKLGEKTYQPIEQNTLEFNVQDFSSGLYWLSIKVKGHDQITKKFIVLK